VAGGGKFISQLLLGPRLRMSGDYPLLSTYALTAWKGSYKKIPKSTVIRELD